MNSRLSRVSVIVLASAFAAGPALAQPVTAPPAPQPPAAKPPAPFPATVVPMVPIDLTPTMVAPALAMPTWTLHADAMMFASEATLLRGSMATLVSDSATLAAGVSAMALDAVEMTAPGFSAFGQAQSVEERQKQREAAERDRERERENRVYEEAYSALGQGRYDRAVERFTDVASMKGARTDASLYWKAYAQDRQGQRAEALTTLAALTRDYPNSRYLKDAKVLEAEVRRNAGQRVNPQDQNDAELKLMALNALQHTSPEQAIPILEKLLQGPESPRLKQQALFVLAQSDSPKAREILKGYARGNSTPELQARAITYLGTHGGRESRAALGEIYSSTQDVDMRKRIIRAFMTAGEKDRLVTIAQTEPAPELRATAVQQLGVMGAHAELAQMYQKETSVDVKKQIIHAIFVSSNTTRMIELARGEQNPELRRTAIRNLGQMGGRDTGDALVEIYAAERDADVKKSVINALAIQDNGTALVSIARKESNSDLKKAIVQRLSTMAGNNKAAAAYMVEILDGK